jgi:hypothetical protein
MSSKNARIEKARRGVFVRSVRLMKGQTPRARPGAQILRAFGYEAVAAYAECSESAVRHAVASGRLDLDSFDSIFKFAAGLRRPAKKDS